MAASQTVTRRRFTKRRLAAIGQAKILGIRAGRDHRFTWVWVVVDCVYIRSWNDGRQAGFARSRDSLWGQSGLPIARSRYAPGSRAASA